MVYAGAFNVAKCAYILFIAVTVVVVTTQPVVPCRTTLLESSFPDKFVK